MPAWDTDKGWLQDLGGVQRPPYVFTPVIDPGKDPPPGSAEVPFWKWEVYEPSELEACTASGVAAAVELVQRTPAQPDRFRPSRAFIYYVARYLLMDEKNNTGSSIYYALRGAFYFGFCREQDWDILKDEVKSDTPPPAGIQDRATRYGIREFRHIDRSVYTPPHEFLLVCKEAIREGHAIIFGALVDEDFLHGEFDNGLDIRLPRPDVMPEQRHCLVAVKYENVGDSGFFWVRDSLGRHRGDEGYLRMPYEYFTRGSLEQRGFLANDFWIVTSASTSGELHVDFQRERERHWRQAADLSGQLVNTYWRVKKQQSPRYAQARGFPPRLNPDER
jgi:C1A family cysteine protease